METIGIKVKSKNQMTYCLKILRKYIEMSIGTIKDHVLNDDFVYECSFVDEEGIKKIISIYNALNAANIESEILEHGRLTNIQFLMNLLNTYNRIDESMDTIIDEELGEHSHL